MKMCTIKRVAKIGVFLALFVIIFCILQFMFSLVNSNSNGVIRFYKLEDESIDALFLGSSQMFCTVDAAKLTEEYDLPSYDFGSGGQIVPTSYYYLQEALKYQKPKVVAVEISRVFSKDFGDSVVALNYALTPLSIEKYHSLRTLFNNDQWKAAWYCVPLFSSHVLWNQTNPIGLIKGVLNYDEGPDTRGFDAADEAEKVDISYLMKDEGVPDSIDEKAADAILDIAELCNQNSIRVMFFKAPAADWTKSDSKAVKEFMEENDLIYLEMNDYLEEMGLDPDTDFANMNHLNKSGASKATDFIANYLTETFDLS